MANLPRGIQRVEWRNDDKQKVVRYCVRIQRKTFNADKLFATVGEAEKFLAESKSDAGRKSILEIDAAEAAHVKAMADFLHSPPLSYYLEKWVELELPKIPSKEDESQIPTANRKPFTDAERKRVSVAKNRVEVIKRVKVEFVPAALRPAVTGVFVSMLVSGKKPFGDFKLAEISKKTAADYIDARLAAGVSPSTVKRDVGFLSSFFGNWLPDYDEAAAAKMSGNPFADRSKKVKLRSADKRRDVRINDFGDGAEDKLIAALRKCRNPEMLKIVSLALATGMRCGEILALTWDRVAERHIQLLAMDTKSRKPRKIPLSEDAKRVLATIPRDEANPGARLFKYSPDGFRSVWNDVRERAGMKGLLAA